MDSPKKLRSKVETSIESEVAKCIIQDIYRQCVLKGGGGAMAPTLILLAPSFGSLTCLDDSGATVCKAPVLPRRHRSKNLGDGSGYR